MPTAQQHEWIVEIGNKESEHEEATDLHRHRAQLMLNLSKIVFKVVGVRQAKPFHLKRPSVRVLASVMSR